MLTEDGKQLYVSWDEYHLLIERLALKVYASGWEFEQILCLARGGLRPGDVLSRVFDKPLGIMSTSSYRAQEGTIQLYRPPAGRAGDLVLGAVGQLQLEVVKYRLENEYDCKVRLEAMSFSHARWVTRKDGADVDVSDLNRAHNTVSVVDVRGRPVLLFMGEWQIRSAERDLPEYVFAETAVGVIVRNE